MHENPVNKILFKISPNPGMRFLNAKQLPLERDIILISSIIFNTEQAIKFGYSVDSVSIPISKETKSKIDISKLSETIEELLTFVLIEDISINFVPKDTTKFKRIKEIPSKETDNICLFSGGVDSFSGILHSLNHYDNDVDGVFVSHGDQTWGVNIYNNLLDMMHGIDKNRFHILYAPPMRSMGYSQLRGLLYCLYASVYMNLFKSKRLIVTECGPTMYQPTFSPYDTVTMTTHPFVLRKAKEIMNILLNNNVDILTPFENLTKAEVVKISPEKRLLKHTHSCITLRFGKNEGACYGCIIRRLGFIVAGVKDTNYTKNPLINENDNSDNLLSLLRFSHDVLLNYENMPFVSKEMIYTYNKLELFERFSLDNVAAIYLLKKKGKKINRNLKNLIVSTIEGVGKETIKSRIDSVRNEEFTPNFIKYVK